MATIKDNVVMQGVSGIIGDMLLFRQRNEKTFISKVPQYRKGNTERLAYLNGRFTAAVGYARTVIRDPLLKRAYEEKSTLKKCAYLTAMADCLKAPFIEAIDYGNYTGGRDSPIKVTAVDDFQVASVWVAVFTGGGVLQEEGAAHLSQEGLWVYLSQTDNTTIAGRLIRVTAKDLPENSTVREVTIP